MSRKRRGRCRPHTDRDPRPCTRCQSDKFLFLLGKGWCVEPAAQIIWGKSGHVPVLDKIRSGPLGSRP